MVVEGKKLLNPEKWKKANFDIMKGDIQNLLKSLLGKFMERSSNTKITIHLSPTINISKIICDWASKNGPSRHKLHLIINILTSIWNIGVL